MKIYQYPKQQEWADLVRRPSQSDPQAEAVVKEIVEQVRKWGDTALRRITGEIEGHVPAELRVSQAEISDACARVPERLKKAIAAAKANIEAFHAAQKLEPVVVETAPGVRLERRSVPIQNVGLYIPGGSAPLFSTVLMLAVPAKVAGCPRVAVCTPADKQGRVADAVLYAASLCGVDEIYKLGGAQAIAALAFGTESIPKVDKIFGPGNRFVMLAKQLVADRVAAIDMPAGPSEVMVVADEGANPEYVAADLLAQCEHGPDSQCMLVCGSPEFAEKVNATVSALLPSLPRRDVAGRALEQSRVVVLETTELAMQFANLYAPEHLILAVRDPEPFATQVVNAGTVFVGDYAPESAGDYATGSNHTLPTAGWARAMSGLGLDSFVRRITFQQLTREGLSELADTITEMAEAEGLEAHARAVELRTGRVTLV